MAAVQGSVSAASTAMTVAGHRSRWRVDIDVVDRARLTRAWTQRELAAAAHVDPGTLSDILAERRRPTLGTIRALCMALDLAFSAVILFPGDGDQLEPLARTEDAEAANPP